MDNRTMTYDNGLTKEQQKIVDARYEELMDDLRKKHPDVHKMMMVELGQLQLASSQKEWKEIKKNLVQLELSL